MEIRVKSFTHKTIALLAVLLFLFNTFSVADAQNCTVSKDHGHGYTSTISSVKKVSTGYQVVLTVSYVGSSGSKGLHHYSVQASNFSDVSFNVTSGIVTGKLNSGPQLSNETFTGFQINEITSFGPSDKGSFTITYTVASLQNQKVNACEYQDNGNVKTKNNIKTFYVKDFQTVYDCLVGCEQPTLTPAGGTYPSAQSVTMTTGTSGATIYYTTNGSVPSTGSASYTGAVTVGSNMTIKAIAVKSGLNNSTVASETYTIAPLVATPTFSTAPGTFTTAQNITLSCTTSGATIRYTTDGTTPDLTSPIYSSAIPVSSNTTIKAMAVKSGYTNSEVVTGVYNVLLLVAAPVFTPTPGTYNTTQSVTIASSTAGASIYYTTDGTIPSINSPLYSTPVSINGNTSLKAFAVKNGMSNSGTTTGDYIIKCAVPSFTPTAGSYNTFQTVTLSSTTPGVSIRYTTDGSNPSSENGTVYSTPIIVNATTLIKAIAYKTGSSSSEVVSSNYVINLDKVSIPTFTPGAGTYTGSQSVTIVSNPKEATIVYTLDGTVPSKTNGIVYSGPVTIDANATLKAYAYTANMIDSEVASGDYKIKPAVITFAPVSGNYTTVQSIVLGCTTPGVTIKYTTDGSAPSPTNGTEYKAAISLSSNVTLKAIAYKTGMEDGDIVSGEYTFQLEKVASPVFSPIPGSYTAMQTVVISSTTAAATIRYTIDGSIPSNTTGTVFDPTVPITVSKNTIINAIAYATGFGNSDVVSGEYKINLSDGVDTDEDGVPDANDDYPTDPSLAFNNYYPNIGFGSLAFEDNWPYKADYDMNDMVIDYRFNQLTNSDNEVVAIKAKLVLRAMGATFHNGFGIEFPVLPSQVSSCVATLKDGSSVPVGNLVSVDPVTGLEKNQAKAVVILFDDGYNVLPQQYSGVGVNTTPSVPFVIPDTINLVITFTEPISSDVFTEQIYNPFIFTNKTRSTEIHLPDYAPTSLANTSLFNTGEDTSSISAKRYYKTSNNLPWAINIHDSYNYPVEKVAIVNAFSHFAAWAQSGGTLFTDWYKDMDGYRVAGNVYTNK